ncbi:hypothetical protein HO173_009315 [Letharia columbiana]|uniref:Uncharacterized protein n=1 Tax=Letharia columbiana TaxID=112416 RepID=A0A8H6FPQ9_9LECA|nr:uncharacterized protein HO173_009315 [Letharia columbiana]KAF6232436.1 hypothetical protein HO173_009315 [Letharia columbiana]
MEYRLLQFHYEGANCDCSNAQDRKWHITSAAEAGIPLSTAPIPNTPDDFLDLGPRRHAFLAKLLGTGGRWEGWKLHAVSQNGYPDDHITNVIITREKEPVPVSVADEEWDVLARGSPSCL